MAEDIRPRILIVDDEETSQHKIRLDTHSDVRALHPNDIDVSDLNWADLVLMDFCIDHWQERDALYQVSLRPRNGLALAAVLREHADANNGEGHNYTAFAIHTAHMGDISKRLHTMNQTPYVVARLNNLEWAFDKADESRFVQSMTLANAVRTVSLAWPEIENRGIEAVSNELLGFDNREDWSQRAVDDVILCQIPLGRSSAATNGLVFLRWLLHGILPYPTFLLSEHWVAARLRITPDSLRKVLLGDSRLAQQLGICRYGGVLDSFCGMRWWRAAIDQYVWSIRSAGAREPDEFHAELERSAGETLDRVKEISPVVCVDCGLSPQDEFLPLDDVVRLVPDLWPGYADPAYAEVNVVSRDAELRAIVHPLDRERVTIGDDEE